jgi:hypothetical protein
LVSLIGGTDSPTINAPSQNPAGPDQA